VHSILCLTHVLHGLCLSHLTFRSAQRMQEYLGLLRVLDGEEAAVAMTSNQAAVPVIKSQELADGAAVIVT
jgi:hypothetical protein